MLEIHKSFDARDISNEELSRYTVSVNGIEVGAVSADERAGFAEIFATEADSNGKQQPVSAGYRQLRVGESVYKGYITYYVVGFVRVVYRPKKASQ